MTYEEEEIISSKLVNSEQYLKLATASVKGSYFALVTLADYTTILEIRRHAPDVV